MFQLPWIYIAIEQNKLIPHSQVKFHGTQSELKSTVQGCWTATVYKAVWATILLHYHVHITIVEPSSSSKGHPYIAQFGDTAHLHGPIWMGPGALHTLLRPDRQKKKVQSASEAQLKTDQHSWLAGTLDCGLYCGPHSCSQGGQLFHCGDQISKEQQEHNTQWVATHLAHSSLYLIG